MSKSVYRMSESGTCPKALTAARLGYEPIAQTTADEYALQYYSMLESVVAKQMISEGYVVEGGEEDMHGQMVPCFICKNRYGIHIELETVLFKMTGHLDRRVVLTDGRRVPAEIKSIGRFTFQKMQASSVFSVYPEYASQMACYLEAEQQPGLYWVLNRDTGENIRYIVNDVKGILNPDNLINFGKFAKVTLPITYQSVIDKLTWVELTAQENQLADGVVTGSCRWCRFQYLCIKEEPEVKSKEETNEELIEAANLYKEGKQYEVMAEDRIAQAKAVLIRHGMNVEKYRVEGVSVTYRGMKREEWLDEKTIRAEAPPELILRATRHSKEYPDYTIRILKERKE